MLRTRELLAEPSLRKRSGTYLPKYLRIPNALRLDGQNPQGQNAPSIPLTPLGFATEHRRPYSSVTFIIEPLYTRKSLAADVGRRTSLRYPSVVLSYHIHEQFANPTKVALNFSINFSGL